jgi:antitoxin (DNA-binding transcriptional repressor) of toxin-antitoxin stability system
MKEISLRELHRNTGAWVRSARKYGSILVRDRNTPVATLTPVTEEPAVTCSRAGGR